MYTQEQKRKRQVQGDVVLIPVASLPANAIKLKTEKKILQMSETTGHHHHFHPTAKVEVYVDGNNGVDQSGFRTITQDDNKYIVVEEVSELFHGTGFDVNPVETGRGDHKSQTVAPGIYKVVITREYCYDSMEPVRVQD